MIKVNFDYSAASTNNCMEFDLFYELLRKSRSFREELVEVLTPYFNEYGWAEITLQSTSIPNKGITNISIPQDPGYLWGICKTISREGGNPHSRHSFKHLWLLIELLLEPQE